jgi:hypothetical protein
MKMDKTPMNRLQRKPHSMEKKESCHKNKWMNIYFAKYAQTYHFCTQFVLMTTI